MITLQILDYENNIVQTWSWDNKRPIPNKGDTLLIHFGESKEKIYRVNVLRREFDNTQLDVIGIVTDYVKLNQNGYEEGMLP